MSVPEQLVHPWEYHAGFYRDVDTTLSKPWESSPIRKDAPHLTPVRPLVALSRARHSPGSSNGTGSIGASTRSAARRSADRHVANANANGNAIRTRRRSGSSPLSPSPTSTVTLNIPTALPPRRRSFWARLKRFIRTGDFSAVETIKVEIPRHNKRSASSSDVPDNSRVKLHEWKEYGYWANTRINNVDCVNSPSGSAKSITTDDLHELIASLRSPEGDHHPERWIPNLKHRSLPQRPARWAHPPTPGVPLAFPWEVQLNPLLQSHLWGPAPLHWILCAEPLEGTVYFGSNTPNLVPLYHSDWAQPATYPFLTHMHFNAVAGDAAPVFPWPFTVENPRGIKLRDVINGIFENFWVPVTDDEFASWRGPRQTVARMIKEQRVKDDAYLAEHEPMRRCDSFGAFMFFRGIEPSVDFGGWTLVFGTRL